MWERIGTGLQTACAKHPDDILSWANACLEHIKADFGKTASMKTFEDQLAFFDRMGDGEQKQFIAFVRQRAHIIIGFARAKWQTLKEHGEA